MLDRIFPNQGFQNKKPNEKVITESKGDIMKNQRTQIITRSAVLLAIAIVFQLSGRYLGPNNNFIVGPAVNAVLFIAAAITGLWGGAAISVLVPLISAFTNKAAIAPLILAFSPFIAVGNYILVLIYHLFMRKNQVFGIFAASIIKTVFLFAAITGFVHFFGPALDIQPKVAAVLTFLFSWPQLVTGITGGILALIVLKALRKSLKQTS